jgi:hypothetical protein
LLLPGETAVDRPLEDSRPLASQLLPELEVALRWEGANKDEAFGVFHMADFVAKKEQFAAAESQMKPSFSGL